jgi:predicted transcriptional regulator
VRLAKAAERNCSYVHPDVTRLDELGPIERTQGGLVLAPYESAGIVLSLAQAA